MLQVIADFTDLNIITSDTVPGNLTLRLKDVPWDQALDIILQTKGLDMRKNGNVVWIAPRDELATKEKLALEAQQQISDLEPLRTETFQLNYSKAESRSAAQRHAVGASGASASILSKRGSAVVDPRTNTLFVQDTPSRLEEVRTLITQIDIPVRQVLIEARIVEATDTFSRTSARGSAIDDLVGSTSAPVRRRRTQASPSAAASRDDRRPTPARSPTRRIFFRRLVQRQPAGDADGHRRAGRPVRDRPCSTARATKFLNLEISALREPTARARSSPARASITAEPGRGADRAGHGDAVPAGDHQRRHQHLVPQGDAQPAGQAADHARRQRDHGPGRQQGRGGRSRPRPASPSTPST